MGDIYGIVLLVIAVVEAVVIGVLLTAYEDADFDVAALIFCALLTAIFWPIVVPVWAGVGIGVLIKRKNERRSQEVEDLKKLDKDLGL